MAYYFLPPIDQYSSVYSQEVIPQNIGDYNRLDPNLATYSLSTGTLQPLLVNGSNVPININGTPNTGATGGFSGNPPAATSFMMVSYAQIVDITNTNLGTGIVQFVLTDGANLKIPSSVGGQPDPDTYYFVSANDVIDLSRVVEIYYTITTSGGIGTTSNPAIRFYDAKAIKANPGNPIDAYEIVTTTNNDYKTKNSFAYWPVKPTFQVDGGNSLIANTYLFFEELNIISNPNPLDLNLKSGKFYHPSNIQLQYPDGSQNGYTEYSSANGYFSGYGPGYPLNINYTYASINRDTIPVITNGNDTGLNLNNQQWPLAVNNSLYNFKASNIRAFNDANVNVDNDVDEFPNGILTCNCSDNNNCYNSNNSYYFQNCNTIQQGIMQYMTYQFIPFEMIKTPASNIVTDFTGTDYSYVNLPQNIDFTPTGYQIPYPPLGPTGATGSYPIQIVQLIAPGVTGSTGVTGSNNLIGGSLPNLISSWMENPNNILYDCTEEISGLSYCGFLDYYDSLYGVSYDYGECGSTGINTNPYVKGACMVGGNTGICVPNYKYLSSLNPYQDVPFICVGENEGVTETNMNYYINSNPIVNGNPDIKVSYPIYDPPPTASNNPPNFEGSKKKGGKDNFFLYIGIFILVVVLLIVIYFIYKAAKNKPNYKAYEAFNI